MKRLWAAAIGAVVLACSGTTVVTGSPPWSLVQRHSSVGKIDILFAIDDSPSMADKQSILAEAIPAFIGRLLNPNCIDINTSASVPGDGQGCATIPNSRAEFVPIRDMHIGIVGSSLGGGGSPDVCLTDAENGKGHLLNRTKSGSIANAMPIDGGGGNFLAWAPAPDPTANVTVYAQNDSAQLIADFQSLVTGVGQTGCGLEAQLESWYRFLIQPDPWESITQTANVPPNNRLSGVDVTVLQMRKDFLRADSVVAIIQLTDEEDSWSDPLWLGGYGWTNRTATFPGGPGSGVGPRGTSECDQPVDINNVTLTGPNNPDCTSCGFPGSTKPISKTLIESDPNCNSCASDDASCAMKGWYSPTADGLNVRYAQQLMRPKYGFDSQFSVQRYIDGLRLPTVPDRDHEGDHVGPSNYATSTQRNCTNPLFARDLPDGTDTSQGALCNLEIGGRIPENVYYALIGGAPRSLVGKLDLLGSDWTKLVGVDPEHYRFGGIDPHMIQSTVARSGIDATTTTYSLGTDPDNGRDWNTLTSIAGIDFEYACTFDLPQPVDCTTSPIGCDCKTSAADGPPLCDATVRTTQIKGKAYPTIRELRVAQGLAQQATVASICSKTYDDAFSNIVERIKPSLASSCLPTTLPRQPDGTLGCVLVAEYDGLSNQAAGCIDPGTSQPPAGIIDSFHADTSSSAVVCAVTQASSCDAQVPGWCAAKSSQCSLELSFTSTWVTPPGAHLLLFCSVTN